MLDQQENDRLKKLYEQLRLKLLDLTRRNRMLNFHLGARSKRHLQIVDEVPDEIYRKLVGEEGTLKIGFLPEPDETPAEEKTEDFVSALEHAKVSDVEYLAKLDALEREGRDDELELAALERNLRHTIRKTLGLPPRPGRGDISRADHARSLGIDPSLELQQAPSKPSHTDQSLQTLKYPDELESILDKIGDQARLAEQEMGISTLFLAFGFLEWYESDHSDKKAIAPLLLLPVKLETQKVRRKDVYFLSAREEGAEANLSLQKLLETDYKRQLPAFESSEEDGAVNPIESYFAAAHDAIDGLKRWGIRRWVVLGHFAFGRFVIYADLSPQKWADHPISHPLVNAILSGAEIDDAGSMPLSIPEDYPIDDPEVEKIAPLLIHDADSSQHSALIDVMRGKNLVIQGPPGTGKSQTITNIIANALAAGKRVLFMAEKQAALDVVKRRLTQAGLGEFCLELHSDRVKSKLVVDSLKARVDLGLGVPPRSVHQSRDFVWSQQRAEIADYLDALHAEGLEGDTPFSLIWKAVRGRTQSAGAFDSFRTLRIPPDLLVDPVRVEDINARLLVHADTAMDFAQNFRHPALSPWAGMSVGSIPRHQAGRLIERLTNLRNVGSQWVEYAKQYAGDLGVIDLTDIKALVDANREIGEPPDEPVIAAIAGLDLEELTRAVHAKSALLEIEHAMSARPNLSEQPLERLALAVALTRCGAPNALLEQTPMEAYATATETISKLTSLVEIIGRLTPLLELLGLEPDYPAEGLPAVAVAAIIVSKITDDQWRWASVFSDEDEAALLEAHRRWCELVTAEHKWREKLSKFGPGPWPPGDQITAAASTLRKHGLRRAFSILDGSTKAAGDLVRRLGFSGKRSVSSAELLDLAHHIEELAAFESDKAIAEILGTAWNGINAPFANIAEGLKQRVYIRGQLDQLRMGRRVRGQIFEMDAERLTRLGAFLDTAHRFTAIDESEKSRLDRRSIPDLSSELVGEIRVLKSFVAVDQEHALAGLDLPIRLIAEIATLRLERERQLAALTNSPAQAELQERGRTRSELAVILRAIEWVGCVRHTPMSEPLRRTLTTATAVRAREVLREAAAAGAIICQAYDKALNEVEQEFEIDNLRDLGASALVDLLDGVLASQAELPDFLGLQAQRRDLADAGLATFLATADSPTLSPSLVPGIFATLVANERAEHALRNASVLSREDGAKLDARRRRFAERDRLKIKNDRSATQAILLQGVPPVGSKSGSKKTWTEMSLLRNEFPKQGRFTPVRGLLARAGRSIQALKPCFMMSPLSLAKFAPAQGLTFDLVLIDEASQMKPEDSLGGLLRAKQLVVVGDSKQLPPTDFFSRSATTGTPSDDEFEDIDDESILEGCEKVFREVRSLKWHYRSRCESLIAFSNKEFYRNSLITFPMARPRSFSIDLVSVGGVYQARRNIAEAGVVAEKAIEFMRSFADETEETIPTLGLVTLNIEQREVLQDELRRLSAGDELVQRYREKVDRKGESVFVKNLENVQGDERDYIFISLTYGREPGSTVVKQRFGPINGKQGHRRLNVLFTRARSRVCLFSSFSADDVKPSETSAEGVHILKRYLEYAERGGRTPFESVGQQADSEFEVEVGERLRAKGYAVDFQVGVSGYRIDIGVRNPEDRGVFLAGIECDGARYHSIKSARDRDRLREEVLRGLGWDILRVWSTDWFAEPELETDKLVRKLEQLRSRSHEAYREYRVTVGQITATEHEEKEEDAQPTDGPVSNIPSEPESINGLLEGIFAPPPRHADGRPLLGEFGRLTEQQAAQALGEFREAVIKREMSDWEPHRSILREGMIETFVRQRLSDPEDWFLKVPQFQRSQTNPVEKQRFLDRICEIVSRIVDEDGGSESDFTLIAEIDSDTDSQEQKQESFANQETSDIISDAESVLGEACHYIVADLASLGLAIRPDVFYEPSYATNIRRMVAHVIQIEGPIYADVLVARVARAHGFQRSGGNIRQLVLSAVQREFPRTTEEGREVLWAAGSATDRPIPYRSASSEVRPHTDIPIAELASLALPFVRLRMEDEVVLRKLAESFALGRLREATRARFLLAVNLAKAALTPRR